MVAFANLEVFVWDIEKEDSFATFVMDSLEIIIIIVLKIFFLLEFDCLEIICITMDD